MTVSSLPYLLLQARNPGDPTAEHELSCFAESLGVPAADIVVHSLLEGPPDQRALEGSRALLVGGSGDYSTLDNLEWVHQFISFLGDELVANQRTAFCSCFGFQGLVIAGGGEVIKDAANTEVGTFQLYTTEAAGDDPLFASLGATFNAQLGHKDRAARLPAGIENLAYSKRCPFQAFRISGTQIVATQFHPELSREANLHRYLRYQEEYIRSGGSTDSGAVTDSMAESEEATDLLRRWGQTVSGP